jgi:hypothetical protein
MSQNVDVNFTSLQMTVKDEIEININQIFTELEEYNIFYENTNLPNDVQKLKDLHQNLNTHINNLTSNKLPINIDANDKLWSVSIALDENDKFKIEAYSKLLEDYEWILKFEWLNLKDDEDFISIEIKDNDLTLKTENNNLKSIIKNSIEELLLQFNINPDYLSEYPNEQLIHPILSLKKAYFNIDKYVVNNKLVKTIHSIDPYVNFSYEARKNIYGKPLIILKSNGFNKLITQITKD